MPALLFSASALQAQTTAGDVAPETPVAMAAPVSVVEPATRLPKKKVDVTEKVWSQFSVSERAAIMAHDIEIAIIPSAQVGIVQSAQLVNRSQAGTNSGALLGAAVAQSMYIDNRLRDGGSNYSASTQIGIGLLGAALGSSLDSAPVRKFIINYGIQTLDGEVSQVLVESGDEFVAPTGRCVYLPGVEPAPSSLCNNDKLAFLSRLSVLGQADPNVVVSEQPLGIQVNCRVPAVGLMSLDRSMCTQLNGTIEK
ncbi:hypothetical protein FXN63_10425 [Pigmentiphaga aceris]|uniref:Uncharacterized protein n=1 Tax=Pigmentiphaga aceris TaxID=1940612 RepID=A0A5C0B0P7_9BURK|nr:hypothetical protein [Pigmentiphaga aceris]QEI06207.1 hypothetical protein FXN63_10425 [Pigmentiphaga aceris]